MVIKREALEALEKSSIISLIMSLISAQSLDTSTATTVAPADEEPSDDVVALVPSSSSETTQSNQLEVTLNEQLLRDFEVQDSRKSDLNRQHDRVVSHSIGMKSKVPQVIRRETKKRKAEDPSKSELLNKKLIDEEGKSDLDLVKEISTLKNCCARCGENSNCIMKHFNVNVAGSSCSRFDFSVVQICSQVLLLYIYTTYSFL